MLSSVPLDATTPVHAHGRVGQDTTGMAGSGGVGWYLFPKCHSACRARLGRGRWEWWEECTLSVVGGSGGSCGSRRIEQLATGRNAPDLASAFRHAHAQHVGSSDASTQCPACRKRCKATQSGGRFQSFYSIYQVVPPIFTQGCVVGLLGGRYM